MRSDPEPRVSSCSPSRVDLNRAVGKEDGSGLRFVYIIEPHFWEVWSKAETTGQRRVQLLIGQAERHERATSTMTICRQRQFVDLCVPLPGEPPLLHFLNLLISVSCFSLPFRDTTKSHYVRHGLQAMHLLEEERKKKDQRCSYNYL